MAASTPVVLASDQSNLNVAVVGTVPVSGPLTDAQLRATPVPISGTVAISGSVAVNVGLTDAQLRATAVPISGTVSVAKTDLTPSAPSAVSVGVASGVLIAANANRRGFKAVNTSNARVSLAFATPAVLNSGITLYPGGVFDMDEYDFDLGEIRAIASLAASNVAIQEFTT